MVGTICNWVRRRDVQRTEAAGSPWSGISLEDAVFTKNDSNLPALLESLPVASSESLPCHPPSQPAETLILQR